VALSNGVPLASIGDNCVDRYVAPTEAQRIGGNALNVAVGLCRHGHHVHYMGVVGDDQDGRSVVEALRHTGVETERVRVAGGEPTGITLVELTPDGERVFLEERHGANDHYVPGAEDLRILETCAWVHAAGMRERSHWLLDLHGPRVSHDFSHPHDQELMLAIAPRLDVAFLSGARISRDEAIARAQSAVDAGAGMAVVTRGTDGSLAYDGTLTERGADAVEVVDTLGAGDAFIAAAISARLDGADHDAMLAAGATAAAETCTFLGAWREEEQ
jgi:fructoselysine 6-kinase